MPEILDWDANAEPAILAARARDGRAEAKGEFDPISSGPTARFVSEAKDAMALYFCELVAHTDHEPEGCVCLPSLSFSVSRAHVFAL